MSYDSELAELNEINNNLIDEILKLRESNKLSREAFVLYRRSAESNSIKLHNKIVELKAELNEGKLLIKEYIDTMQNGSMAADAIDEMLNTVIFMKREYDIKFMIERYAAQLRKDAG